MYGSQTMRAALTEHLVASGLPPDAGASEPFVVVKLMVVPYPIPNTKARQRAVKVHDLNHIISGYATDRVGELEISAWELASGGCGHYAAAWVLGLAGLFGGLLLAPRRTWRAFMTGRRQQNLYPFQFEELLALTVIEADALAQDPRPGPLRSLPAQLHLLSLVLISLPVAVVMSAAWYVLLPAWAVSSAWRRRSGGARVPVTS
jgi:hypothetical protein